MCCCYCGTRCNEAGQVGGKCSQGRCLFDGRIEEKPKKPKKEVFKKEVERPIAKKVLLPKKEEQKIEELDEEEYLDEDFEIQPKKEEKREIREEEILDEVNDFKVMDDEDFRVEEEKNFRPVEPKIVKVFEKDERPVREEVHYYQNRRKRQFRKARCCKCY